MHAINSSLYKNTKIRAQILANHQHIPRYLYEHEMMVIYSIIWKTLSANFSSSRHDRKKLNTDSESALKAALKSGLKSV